MPISPGEKLGPYEIVAPLGAGGMGEVYRARDPKLNRDVAIKVLPAALANDAQYMARFEREAQMLAALNHPNIATVYGIEQGALVMELIEGADLRGPLPLDEALAIARQIAAGLEAAHEKGIIHRDLKPANIKLTPAGVVKILDFGLAKSTEPGPAGSSATMSPTLSLEMTRAGMILGTAAYMSPEQARGKVVDKRTDIWAFGVVLYEIVTGKQLFEGEDLTETLAKVVRDRVDLGEVPAKVRPLLERCLEKDPKKRLRDIGDMELLLAESGGTASPTQAASLPHRSWAWMAATAVLAVAVAGLAFFAVPHFREKPPALVKFTLPPPGSGTIDENIGPPAVSPDGRRIAFLARTQGARAIWVRDLESLDARPLPATEGADSPFWAPDSRRLAFHASGKLMKIDVTGGPATTIASAQTVRGGDWSQDDVIVFAAPGSGVFRVSAAGGTPAPVAGLDKSRSETGHFYPQFLPDGRHFLYFTQSAEAEKSAIFVGDLQSKDKKLVLLAASHARYVEPGGEAHQENGYLLFVRERSLMAQPFDAGKLQTTGEAVPVAEQVDVPRSVYGYFGSSRSGVLAYASGGAGAAQQMTWYDRSGKVVGAVGKPADVQAPRISPNGKMVAADRMDLQANRREIWLYDLARGGEQRLAFGDQPLFYPVWSPDSLSVAYSRTGGASDGAVLVKSADGAGQEEVLESARKWPMDWTRDGRYLISATISTNPKTGNDLWALPLSEGKPAGKPVPLRETEFAEWHGRVSPDGRWLAYDSNDSKRREVYVVGFPDLKGRWQVSVDGGRFPAWSRDGRELYFVGANGTKLMAVAIKAGTQFEAGVPKALFDVRLGSSNPSYDVSADARFLIATPVEQAATLPMTVLLNWQTMLKK